jgi:hypothetical protein
MNEEAIRQAIRIRLPRILRGSKSARLVEEMEICSGRARADMAIISDDLIGIEIKSPQDSLDRLPSQIEPYSKCFDRVVLVIDESHAKKAMTLVPRWWGIIVTPAHIGRAPYVLRRRPRLNRLVDTQELLTLLWRDELDTAFKQLLGTDPPTRLSKRQLRSELLAGADPASLRREAITLLRERRNWRSISIDRLALRTESPRSESHVTI